MQRHRCLAWQYQYFARRYRRSVWWYRSFRRYRWLWCWYNSQMCNRDANPWDMGIFSGPVWTNSCEMSHVDTGYSWFANEWSVSIWQWWCEVVSAPSLHSLSGAVHFLYKLMCAALFTMSPKEKKERKKGKDTNVFISFAMYYINKLQRCPCYACIV